MHYLRAGLRSVGLTSTRSRNQSSCPLETVQFTADVVCRPGRVAAFSASSVATVYSLCVFLECAMNDYRALCYVRV